MAIAEVTESTRYCPNEMAICFIIVVSAIYYPIALDQDFDKKPLVLWIWEIKYKNIRDNHILIYFLAFRPSATPSPAAAVGPTHMIFGTKVCLYYGMLIFGKLGTKVKGQGKKSMKICLFGPILVIGLNSGYIEGRGVSGWVLLAACQLFLAVCQMLQKSRGASVEGSDTIGRLPAWLPRCQLWKKPRPKQRAIARCEVHVSIYITYVSVSKPTHGQWPAPIGSWRVIHWLYTYSFHS